MPTYRFERYVAVNPLESYGELVDRLEIEADDLRAAVEVAWDHCKTVPGAVNLGVLYDPAGAPYTRLDLRRAQRT
jgi:hypothetical protein